MLCPLYFENSNAISAYTKLLCKGLVSRGSEITLVTSVVKDGIAADSINNKSAGEIFSNQIFVDFNWRGFWALTRMLAHNKKQVMLAIQFQPFLFKRRGGMNFSLPLFVFVARLMGVPILTMVHEPYHPFSNFWQSWIMGFFQPLIFGSILLTSNQVFFSTTVWLKKFSNAIPFLASKFKLAPIFANFERYNEANPEQMPVKVKKILAEQKTFSLIWGGLHVTKLSHEVWDAYQLLLNSHPNHYLVAVGQSEKQLKIFFGWDRLPEKFINLGFLQPEEVVATVKAAKVVLAPFTDGLTERRGSALVSLFLGTPLISTRSSDLSPLFDPIIPCLLELPLGVSQMAALWKHLLENKDLSERMGRAGQDLYFQHFSIKYSIERYHEFFRTH